MCVASAEGIGFTPQRVKMLFRVTQFGERTFHCVDTMARLPVGLTRFRSSEKEVSRERG
jgi:hypothetical protein